MCQALAYKAKDTEVCLSTHLSIGMTTDGQLYSKVGNVVSDLFLGNTAERQKIGLGQEDFLEEGPPMLCLVEQVGISQLKRCGKRKAFQGVATA